MTDYQENTDNESLLNAIKFLGIRFPVAEIVRKTGYSKSVVSTYLKKGSKPSNDFLEKFEECFSVKLEHFNPNMNDSISEPNPDYTDRPDYDSQIIELEEKIIEQLKYIKSLNQLDKDIAHETTVLNIWKKHLAILKEAKADFYKNL